MRWEYKVLNLKVITDEYLNYLGQRGWELVCIYDGMIYFKKSYSENRNMQ